MIHFVTSGISTILQIWRRVLGIVNRAFTRLTMREAPGASNARRISGLSRRCLFPYLYSLQNRLSCRLIVTVNRIPRSYFHDKHETQVRARPTVSSHESPHLAITRHDATDYACITYACVSDNSGTSPIVAPQTAPPHARQWMCDVRFRVGEKETRARGRRLIVSFCSFIPEHHAACRLIDRDGRGTLTTEVDKAEIFRIVATNSQ